VDLKPRLSGENSIITSLATVGLVVGVYQATVGPVSDVHATDAGDVNLTKATRKAGVVSLAAVFGLSALSHDMNILILGGAAIIAEELCYRHALLSTPHTGQLQVTPASYQPASSNVSDAGGQLAAAAG